MPARAICEFLARCLVKFSLLKPQELLLGYQHLYLQLDLSRKSAGYLSHLRRQSFKRERAFAA